VLFGTFLQSARAVERSRGVDFRQLASDASKLTPYVQAHMSEALLSLETLYTKLPSTLRPEDHQRATWEGLRTEYVAEIRGALDHIAAILTVVGCTEDELATVGETGNSGESNGVSEGCTDSEDFLRDVTVQIPLPGVMDIVPAVVGK